MTQQEREARMRAQSSSGVLLRNPLTSRVRLFRHSAPNTMTSSMASQEAVRVTERLCACLVTNRGCSCLTSVAPRGPHPNAHARQW